MAYPVWPSCLPLPQIAGYTVGMGDAVNARDIDGQVIARNRFRRQSEAVGVALVMTGLQFGIFEAWFKHEIASGAAWFTLTLDGEDLASHVARIDGGYKAALDGTAWRVSMSTLVDAPPEGT